MGKGLARKREGSRVFFSGKLRSVLLHGCEGRGAAEKWSDLGCTQQLMFSFRGRWGQQGKKVFLGHGVTPEVSLWGHRWRPHATTLSPGVGRAQGRRVDKPRTLLHGSVILATRCSNKESHHLKFCSVVLRLLFDVGFRGGSSSPDRSSNSDKHLAVRFFFFFSFCFFVFGSGRLRSSSAVRFTLDRMIP